VGGLFLLGLATTLAYFLLANDTDVSKTLTELVGGRDSTAYAYAIAVDADLESVFSAICCSLSPRPSWRP